MGKRLFPDDYLRDWIRKQNPWWDHRPYPFEELPRQKRLFTTMFTSMVLENHKTRAWMVVGGPRVGKTTLVLSTAQALLATQTAAATQVCYLNLSHPVVSGIALTELVQLALDEAMRGTQEQLYFLLDQAEYQPNWPEQLPQLQQAFPSMKLLFATSVDSTRLSPGSQESMATLETFLLPPPTFHEFLKLRGVERDAVRKPEEMGEFFISNSDLVYKRVRMTRMNSLFVEYLNHGGLPELYESLANAPLAETSQHRNRVVNQMLTSDLPAIYGIADTRTLIHFYAYLAYISGVETSVEEMASNFSLAKNTIRKYLQWLEAAQLIKLVERVDMDGKHFDRANFFKLYLTNATLRSALFVDISEDDVFSGNVVETAIFAQLMHRTQSLPCYSSWSRGSVDLIRLGSTGRPNFALEIKWSNQFVEKPTLLKNLRAFCKRNDLKEAYVTTLDLRKDRKRNELVYKFVPASFFAYVMGRNMVYTKVQFNELEA